MEPQYHIERVKVTTNVEIFKEISDSLLGLEIKTVQWLIPNLKRLRMLLNHERSEELKEPIILIA